MRTSPDPAPRRRILLLLAGILALVAAPGDLAAQMDVIRGRVTNTEGSPLQNVRVTATSIPGSVTRDTRTDARGAFQIVFPGGQGDYIMGYALIGYNFRQFQIKRLADEDVLIADARLSVVQLDTVSIVASVQQRVNRNTQTPDVSGTERAIPTSSLPPEIQGDIAAMAASLPGVLLLPGIDGGPDGFSVLGLGADQNSTTLNGLELGANGLPRDASISSSLSTSPFDPSRGGFSGANFNVRTGSGSNFRTRGMSLLVNTPQLQWSDRAGQALGSEFTRLSLSGIASGPIVMNKAFYNVSYQLDRNSRDQQTLLGTSPLGLLATGVAPDSVVRFVDILGRGGIPTTAGPLRADRVSNSGSILGSIDLSPPSSASGQTFNVTFNGSWGKQSPVGGGPTQLASSNGDRTNFGLGLQGRHSSYYKMILTETSAGVNMSRDYGEPYLDLPSGRVRVSSDLDGGASGVQMLTFGGNQGLSSSSRSTSGTVQNTLSWFDDANKHRLKLTTELQYRSSAQDQSSNLLGTFSFNSLEDLEAGRASSFTRTLTARRRTTGQVGGSMALGDSYRHTPNVQFQYGLRADLSRFTTTPAYNAAVETAFDRRNDRIPSSLVLSPRFGFSWTLGTANEIGAFTGAIRAPRAVIRGGVGVFSNSSGIGQIGSALDNTGLPSGVQQILCVGPAAPIADWAAFAGDPGTIPDRCADGTAGTVFSNSAPNVTLFAKDFAPQRTVRSNLSWSGSLLDARFSTTVEATYSLNLNQQRSIDLNFRPETRFTLADEQDRPVFVAPTSIVATTGAIASRDARVSQAFSRVTEVRSDLQSRTAQLSLRLSPIYRTPTRFGWSANYTYSHITEQVSGFSSTVGNPLGIEWARSGQGPHQISYNLRYNFFDAVQVSWNGSIRSGSAFTPMIAGDVNGDGYSNDRAFVPSPDAATDAGLASAMRELLADAPDGTRACLERQLGNLASRNSCRAPWTSDASLNITLDRAKFRMPYRAGLQFSLQNPLGAADMAINGAGNLRGWGQRVSPDQSLLYVRGFDAATQQYRYEVNRRFGAPRSQVVTLMNPVTLTATMRYDLGPTREAQNLSQQLDMGRRIPGAKWSPSMYRSIGSGSIANPMVSVLRSQDTLQLTAVQADSIASMNRIYTYRADSLWVPVAQYLATLPDKYDSDEAYDRFLDARRAQIDMLIRIVPLVRELLTPEQRRRLPSFVVTSLDPRYLVSIRNGTGSYAMGGGGFIGSPPPPGAFFAIESMVIHR